MTTRQVPAGLAAKLTQAAESFASSFDAVRMDDIANASGVPRATLYYYFSGKDEVLSFLLRSMLVDLRLSVAIAADRDGDVHTRLSAVIRAQLRHLAANPGASQLLLANLGKAGRLPMIAAGIDEGFHAPVREILAAGVGSGTLEDLDIETTTTALFGAVTIVGFQGLVLDGRIDVDRVADALLAVFSFGIFQSGNAKQKKRQQ